MANALPKHYEKTLENGLKVVVIPLENHSNVIATNIFYRVGSRNEIMGKSGIAHMLEHLNFKSSKNLKAGEFDQIIKRFGGTTNASTGLDYTHYYIKSSTKNLDKSLELFSELMQNLALKDEEFQPERNVVAEERRWRTENDPFGYLYFRLFNTAYTYHPYHWTPIGFMADIENWTIEDIRSFHKIYYQPKNAIVVVSGDIQPEIVFQSVEKHFNTIKNQADLPTFYQKEPPQDGPRRAIVKKESEVEMVAIAFKTPPFNHKDQLALDMLSFILGSGKSSQLNRNIVEKNRLASSIYVRNMDTIDDGIFFILGIANPNINAKKVETGILDQIEKLQRGDISDNEIAKVKKNLLSSFVYSIESSSSIASLFGSYYAKGDITPLLEFEEKLQKITKQDIIAVANRYFTKNVRTTLILKK
ncbi:peptidase M16 [Helicobacter monodelphidis]|uniref:M16 family metallopeptidase n=1 Tax=Helicobacter sp. 15-1451 TaxID=2004995 RepID=UPI000DCD2EEF|nr:pitrilysin family protein [Helicobacter sp. 15-1451]RAX57445.1 peptidase M16 [Helicobacter sp. 15-1451]